MLLQGGNLHIALSLRMTGRDLHFAGPPTFLSHIMSYGYFPLCDLSGICLEFVWHLLGSIQLFTQPSASSHIWDARYFRSHPFQAGRQDTGHTVDSCWSERGNGEWQLWPVHNTLSLPLPPHTVSLLHHRLSPMGYSPSWTSNVGPFHRLRFFKNCSSMGARYGIGFFRNKAAPAWAPPLQGLQLLSGPCTLHGLSIGCSLFWGISTCMGSYIGFSVDICFHVLLHGL